MDRRNFLKISAIGAGALALSPLVKASAAQVESFAPIVVREAPDDYEILSEKKKDGYKLVSARPSERVCSSRMDFKIKLSDKTLHELKITGGCAGNTAGIAALVEGLPVKEVIRRLKGIPCGRRGTSCPDQLARILETVA